MFPSDFTPEFENIFVSFMALSYNYDGGFGFISMLKKEFSPFYCANFPVTQHSDPSTYTVMNHIRWFLIP
jgi:hypothetical protein